MNKVASKKANGYNEFFKEKCRESNLKLTPQRFAVYQELLKSRDHPSADVIFRRLRKLFPNISLDTVNRTLLTFYKVGIAQIVEGSGVPKRFDANRDQHHHFRCISCNGIIDVYGDSFDNIKIPEEIKRQFIVMNKTVHLEGICDKCRGKPR